MTLSDEVTRGWEPIEPQVDNVAEFREIVHDFGDPLEILREAVSNAIDFHATWMEIAFSVDNIDGADRSVITLRDNGDGMTREVLSKYFWGLGYSASRGRPGAIGQKGHGTKIYLRSEAVSVRTQNKEDAYVSECLRPMSSLAKGRLHEPRVAPAEKFWDHTGTEIKIIGYNDNVRQKFVREIVEDYLLWFTKVGSIEQMFDIHAYDDFVVRLKCLDQNDFDAIRFGHRFPEQNSDIERLFDEKGVGAADWYVKRYVWKDQRLKDHPEVTFDAVVSVEGDEIKRSYNPMIRQRRRAELGHYRVRDRYGLWLCKDYIPVRPANEWITGFGSGSDAFVLLHAFVNCQKLSLTANRGDVANTNPVILEELRCEVQKLISDVNKELDGKGIYTLRDWQEENRTLDQERREFARRTKSLRSRRVAQLDKRLLLEPQNESELFGLLLTVYTLYPEIFEFEPLDYNTTRGIDIIARNKTDSVITEGNHWYVELKYALQANRFNHAFQYLRWIVCWDFDKSVAPGSELQGIEENDIRRLQTAKDGAYDLYFLDSPKKPKKIQVIRLKEYLRQHLGLEFDVQRSLDS